MRPRPPSLEQIFATQLQTLATTLRPGALSGYHTTLRHFLAYLRAIFPHLQRLSQLRRNPHMVGYLHRLAEQQPPLSSKTRCNYLVALRRVLEDCADQGHRLPPGLILRQDFPPLPRCLPRALSPEDDQRLQQELRRRDDLESLALLLLRATGMRIGECLDLSLDCLRAIGDQQWALHVPLGKLHTERLIPADENIRSLVTRILSLRAVAPPAWLPGSPGWLLPRPYSRDHLARTLRHALAHTARRAACSQPVVPHQLRHTFASEMVRLGISLPALMRLLGHTDIRMTLRYVSVTQSDTQDHFHRARQNKTPAHYLPNLSPVPDGSATLPDIPGIGRALATTRHLLEIFCRQLTDPKIQRKLRRLDRRLLNVALRLNQLTISQK